MKNSPYVLISFIFISFVSFNYTETYGQKVIQKKQEIKPMKEQTKQIINECFIMRAGKLYHFKNGKEQVVLKETDFFQMKMMPNGSCKMKNGKMIKLNDGECCDQNGEIHKDCEKLLKKS
jgi:hypothetical protein